MVADQFPVFKLVTLLARQLSSPIALQIKKYAVSRPRVGGLMCRRVAQTYHECEWLARVWTLRLAGVSLPKTARAPPLRDQAAINLGGDLLGEIIFFTIGSLIIIFEVNRQAANKETKTTSDGQILYYRLCPTSVDHTAAVGMVITDSVVTLTSYCSKSLEKKSKWVAITLTLEEIQHELNLQQGEIDRLHATLLALQQNQSSTK